MIVDSPSTHEEDVAYDRLPVLSQIETDRFCEGCGYNLRMQGVRRDLRLDILLVRCPECNRYHPVSVAGSPMQVWAQRIIRMILAGYVLILLGFLFGLGAGHVGITIGSIEELGRRSWQQVKTSSGTYNYVETGLALYQRTESEQYLWLLGFSLAGSLALGFVGVGLATVFFHHWRRWGYIVFAAAIPFIGLSIIWAVLYYDAPPSMQFGYIYANRFAAAQIFGGMLAVWTARPLARLMAKMFLPAGLRAYVSFLWSADGLQPPAKATSSKPVIAH